MMDSEELACVSGKSFQKLIKSSDLSERTGHGRGKKGKNGFETGAERERERRELGAAGSGGTGRDAVLSVATALELRRVRTHSSPSPPDGDGVHCTGTAPKCHFLLQPRSDFGRKTSHFQLLPRDSSPSLLPWFYASSLQTRLRSGLRGPGTKCSF